MVNRDLVVVAELTEELATVGDGVVKVARNLDGLTLLLLDQRQNVLLGLGNVLGSASNLDSSLSVSLAGDIDGDGELGLELTLSITTSADQGAVVLDRNIHHLGNLALTLANNLLDALNDLLHNISAALNLDSVTISLLLGELDGTGKLPSVIRATRLDDNIAEVGTWEY
jgi:hypothetical protein